MNNSTSNIGGKIGGLILIGVGLLALLGQFLRFDVWHYLWPLFFVGLGLLFFVGMFVGGKEAGGLAIPGTILTTLGLLFTYQNLFNHWESWAYAWALVAPTSVGVGLLIFARWSDKPNLYQPGKALITIGLIFFVVMGAFFELMLAWSGAVTPGRFLWPLLLIVLGVVLLFSGVFRWIFASLPPTHSTPGGEALPPKTTGGNA
jgi:LiaI-LiaF-like transmembrane region